MEHLFNIANKHIAVFGAGRSGIAAAKLALQEGAVVSIWDERDLSGRDDLPQEARIHSNFSLDDLASFQADFIVISPGIDTYSPLVQAFAEKARLIGETEFASKFYEGSIIGITGTNGKTTTTELIGLILKHAGLGGTPCGNYGPPLSEVVLNSPHPAAIALELSSFQLETIDELRPKVAIWLNFAADHMDRYPSIEAYKAAKLRIFENQTEKDTVVVRLGEELGQLKPKIITFSTESRDADFYSDGTTVNQGGRVLLDMIADTSLRGLHNAENVMAAMAACIGFGIDASIIPPALAGYAPPPHRCELIRTLDGVEYLNDSKATNLHALQCALRSQNRPVILIAGGKDKGLDYTSVLVDLKKKCLGAVTYGEVGRHLAEVFGQSVSTTSVKNLDEAVSLARSIAPRGSTVLLSPGTSSFDQFKGYEHRGNSFRDLVHQLI